MLGILIFKPGRFPSSPSIKHLWSLELYYTDNLLILKTIIIDYSELTFPHLSHFGYTKHLNTAIYFIL